MAHGRAVLLPSWIEVNGVRSAAVGKAARLSIYWQDTAYRLVIPERQVEFAQLYKFNQNLFSTSHTRITFKKHINTMQMIWGMWSKGQEARGDHIPIQRKKYHHQSGEQQSSLKPALVLSTGINITALQEETQFAGQCNIVVCAILAKLTLFDFWKYEMADCFASFQEKFVLKKLITLRN